MMTLLPAALAVLAGLALLAWSADRFVEGAAACARHFGVTPLVIGMVIVGFGTSAPELVVSAIAATEGNPGLALGNAFGSNITNIALILGLTAALSPIAMHSQVLRKELPILTAISLLTVFLLFDLELARLDAIILLVVFALIMGWSVIQGMRQPESVDALGLAVDEELIAHPMPMSRALTNLGVGFVVLVISSRLLVWGAVTIAQTFGVSDLIIGLTVVAIGTSLPELAAAIAAVRKNEHDLALGNVVGSNLFNTLGVIGIAGTIHPTAVEPAMLHRDSLVMLALTVSLFVFGYGFRGPGRINRIEGGVLLLAYIAYTTWLVLDMTRQATQV